MKMDYGNRNVAVLKLINERTEESFQTNNYQHIGKSQKYDLE